MNANTVIGQPDFTSSSQVLSQSGLAIPQGVALDDSGDLFVADTEHIRVLEFQPPFLNGMNASVVIGQPNFTTAVGALSQSGFGFPTRVGVDLAGDLFVADTNNSRILEFEPPFTNGMNASVVIGQPGFTSSAPATSRAGLSGPRGIAFDPADRLFVADNLNHRVMVFEPPFTSGMNARVVIGQPDFTTSGVATSQNGFASTIGVAIDSGGNLFVADVFNNRVMEFRPPFSNGMNASVVIGQPDFTSGTPATTQDGLASPRGVSLDQQGNLFVADNGNSRVLEFKPPFATDMNASVVIGQPDFTSKAIATKRNGLAQPDDTAAR